jgi:hypothetical protein
MLSFNGSHITFPRAIVWPSNEPAVPADRGDVVAPEPYIVYYIPGGDRDMCFAYALREGNLVSVYEFDGSRRDQAFLNWAQHLQDAWIAVSKSEALSRVNKQAEVTKSVDEMVPAFEGPIIGLNPEYPRYYVPCEWHDDAFAYIVRDSTGCLTTIDVDGSTRESLPLSTRKWDSDYDGFVSAGSWIEVDEATAFARIKPPVKRVPVDLWVTYRVDSEGGDWPVRCTRAGGTLQNWKKIQMDGNGELYIEVENG